MTPLVLFLLISVSTARPQSGCSSGQTASNLCHRGGENYIQVRGSNTSSANSIANIRVRSPATNKIIFIKKSRNPQPGSPVAPDSLGNPEKEVIFITVKRIDQIAEESGRPYLPKKPPKQSLEYKTVVDTDLQKPLQTISEPIKPPKIKLITAKTKGATHFQNNQTLNQSS